MINIIQSYGNAYIYSWNIVLTKFVIHKNTIFLSKKKMHIFFLIINFIYLIKF